MDKAMVFFTAEQGNLLVRLVLAHLLADFVFQTKYMVAHKKWFSKGMMAHIGVVGGVTLIGSLNWQLSLGIALSHWIIDSIKVQLQTRYERQEQTLFFVDQGLHVGVLLLLWAAWFHIWPEIIKATLFPIHHYATSLLVLAYVWIIWPVGFLLKFALAGIARTNVQTTKVERIEHGGKLIGQFERIIILTFVLLNQFPAIGFLITGKSIIRIAQNDEHLRSEYILVGTMMSYSISILTGVIVNWLLAMA